MKPVSQPRSAQTFQTVNLVLLILAVATYIGLTVLFPIPKTSSTVTYHISTPVIIALTATLLAPWVASWTLGVIGYIRLERYAASIKDQASAHPFRLLSRGIMVLVWGLIAATLISTVRGHYPDAQQLVAPTAIVVNYLYAFTPLIGLYFIWQALRELGYGKINFKRPTPAAVMAALSLVLLSTVYIALTFTNPNRQTGSGTITPTYYLADWLIVVTIILPVIISWTFGFLAIANMYQYQRTVSGFIYRKFMSALSYGIMLIVAGAIFLQGLQSTGNQRLLGAGIPAVFALLYVFLLMQLFGYILVSRGSKKLTLIETM